MKQWHEFSASQSVTGVSQNFICAADELGSLYASRFCFFSFGTHAVGSEPSDRASPHKQANVPWQTLLE